MTSTNRAAISTRVSQCLAATALMAGLAIGSATVASAEPNSGEWDIGTYDACVKKGLSKRYCCNKSGGVYSTRTLAGPAESTTCATAPAPLESEPGQTVAPPVLENPPAQTVTPPAITVPRGPSSGTLG